MRDITVTQGNRLATGLSFGRSTKSADDNVKVCTPKLGTEQPNRTEGMPGTPDEASQGQADQPCDGGLGESAQAQPSQPALPSTSQGQPASQPTQQRGRRGWESEDKNAPLFPWENLVRLREDKRKDAIEYLVARDDPFCVFCSGDIVKRPDGEWETDIDHMDRNTRNNKRWNLRLAHHGCNSTDGNNLRQSQPAPSMPAMPESERVSSVCGEEARDAIASGKVGEYAFHATRPWRNREGEKHDAERAGWNKWIRNLENGPFEGIGAVISLDALSKMAVHGVGMGSSKVYRVYAEEDQFGKTRKEPGILRIFKRDGVKMVEYRGPSKIQPLSIPEVPQVPQTDQKMEEDDT